MKRRINVKGLPHAAARYFGEALITGYGPVAAKFPRFAHYSRRWTALVLFVMAIWGYVPVPHGIPVWWRTLNAVFTVFGITVIWLGLAHTARLCDYCIREFPLNGPELAAQRRKRLWVSHFHWKRWMFGPIATGLVMARVNPHIGLHGAWAATTVVIPGVIFAWAFQRFFLTHDRLSAWCPWCRHNRPPEDAPQPQPEPSEDNPVPA